MFTMPTAPHQQPDTRTEQEYDDAIGWTDLVNAGLTGPQREARRP